MLNKCPECGGMLSDTALFCPHCGYTPKQSKPRAKRTRRKLPNGFGSVKKLSKNRTYAYGAYPPTKEYYDNGSPKPVPAIGYYKTYNEAYAALVEYNKSPYDIEAKKATFADIYELFMLDKFAEGNTLSYSAKYSYTTPYKNVNAIKDVPMQLLKAEDFQKVIDDCPLKYSSKELIRNLFHQVCKFAMARDYIVKDYSQYITINAIDDDIHGVPLTDDEIHTLVRSGDKIGLILLYTGMRISELKTIIRESEHFYRGGLKTKAGRNRLIPIHPAIQGIDFSPKTFSVVKYRKQFSEMFPNHTPHDLRHTTTWLMQKYGLDDLATKMILGHSRGNDIEKSIYGHRTEEQLYNEILKLPDFVSLICH